MWGCSEFLQSGSYLSYFNFLVISGKGISQAEAEGQQKDSWAESATDEVGAGEADIRAKPGAGQDEES